MLLPLALAACALAHPNSVSSSRLSVDGLELRLVLRCQARTLIESLAQVDADGDGMLAAAELEAARPTLQAYLDANYRLAVDCQDTFASGRPVALVLDDVRLAQGELRGAPAGELLVDWRAHASCSSAPHSLALDTTLFRESDPWHRDHAEIAWNGAAPVARVLWVEDPQWIFAAGSGARGGVLGSYVVLGIEHILTGYDHIAFLLALIVAARRWRSLLWVVTAFTLAHSLTLASAALGLFDLPASIVEPAIALSIAWVGIRNLFAQPPARLWPEAFGFGLLHGLGFAGAIAATLAAERQKLQALLGFNLGVECGQLAIVAASVLLLRAIARARPFSAQAREASLSPAGLRRVTACVVTLLGMWWFVQRVSR